MSGTSAADAVAVMEDFDSLALPSDARQRTETATRGGLRLSPWNGLMRNMQRLIALSVPAAALVFCMGAQAAVASCDLNVNTISTPPDGNLFATFSGSSGSLSYVGLCSLNATLDGITPQTCRGIHATLMMAKATSCPVRLWFDSPTAFTCTGLSWSALRAAGWYWGPELL